MTTPYAGNAANYPEAVNVPSGSDVPTSTLFATAYEGEIDRSAWLRARLISKAINEHTLPVLPILSPGLGFNRIPPFVAQQGTGPWQWSTVGAYDKANRQWLVPYLAQVGGGGSALPGTYTVSTGSGACLASSDPTGDIQIGQLVEFSSQSGVFYVVTGVSSGGLNVFPPYSGTGSSSATATAPSLATHMAWSADGGKLWNDGPDSLANSNPTLCMACAPVSTPSAYRVVNVSSFNRRWYNTNTLALSASATEPVPTVATCFYFAAPNEYIEVGTTQSGGSFTGSAYTASSSPTAGTITDVHTSLPSSWQSGTATVTGLLSAVGNTTQNDAVVAMQCSSGQDRLLHVTYPSSTLTFADVTPAFITGGLHITGLAYDVFNGLWGVLLSNGALWTTPDPISSSSTWTQVCTLSAGDASLAVVSGVWAVGRTSAISPSGNVYPQVWISFDVPTGTAAFHPTDVFFPNGAGALTLVSSGTQILALPAGGLSLSVTGNYGYPL